MIQAFGNTHDGGEAAGDAFIGIAKDGIGQMMAVGLGFAIVIAHHRGDQGAVAAIESGNVAVQRQILAMLMVAAMTDTVTDVVKQRASFELHPRLNGQVVYGLELVE